MRSLPKRRNPLVAPAKAPPFEELLSRRRLGKTKLSVKPGQIGTSSATREENLGSFEYAHLRAPLPDDLKGSELFIAGPNQAHPESYFLMRRSKDGFVSATGMFKIAFPWAQIAEEKTERDYLKSLISTSQDEVAGNVWIEPVFALELAQEYGLFEWVRALLDPSDFLETPGSTKKQTIKSPPKFDVPKLPPPSAKKTPKSRSVKSQSPSKIASPTKGGVKASPRKRQTKADKQAAIANAEAASETLQSALNDAASIAAEESSPALDGEKVKVEVDQSVDVTGNTETTHTNVTVEMPAGSPNLPLPKDTEKMLETAKKMVEEAKALEGSPKLSRKRKAEEVEPSDIDAELPLQPAKKAKVLEERIKREKVRNRAMVGVVATAVFGLAVSFYF